MAINYDQAKWGSPVFGTPAGTVEWSFARFHAGLEGNAPYANAEAYANVIRAAFDYWGSIARIDLVEVAGTALADITVGWSGIDGPGSTAGQAAWRGFSTASGAYRTEATVRFDGAESWDLGGGPVNFRAVALHEVGHALGLGHSDMPSSLMYPILFNQRGPNAEDIAAMREIYGARPQPAAPTPSDDDVFRFLDTRTGTHFFTDSVAERDQILATLPGYRLEGNAFDAVEGPAADLQVFRFLNTDTGTHFYTASVDERDDVLETLPQYRLEGAVYRASSDSEGGQLDALHRFYDTRTGTHFYTADENEMARIVSTLPGYQHEGIAYYVDFA